MNFCFFLFISLNIYYISKFDRIILRELNEKLVEMKQKSKAKNLKLSLNLELVELVIIYSKLIKDMF